MITTIDLEDLLYQHLKAGALDTATTGGLYKRDMPINSIKEDVVINSLPVNNLQLQTGLVNVNIHVPNLTVTQNSVSQKISNTVRLKQLANLAISELNEVAIGDTFFYIQQQMLFTEEDSSYINIRLDIYNINT